MSIGNDGDMNTTDLGRFFFHIVPLSGAPFVHVADSQMIEPPFRSSKVLIFRLPFRRGLVLGWWRDSGMTEDEALLQAIHGFGIHLDGADLDNPEVRAQIRENISAATESVDDEWAIISALGVADA